MHILIDFPEERTYKFQNQSLYFSMSNGRNLEPELFLIMLLAGLKEIIRDCVTEVVDDSLKNAKNLLVFLILTQ